MARLNKCLGSNGPVPLADFAELVNVRDSVIHADSKTEWEWNGTLREVKVYRDYYDGVAVESSQVDEAVRKAVEQVKWYDEALRKR
jgi:hypothetical protein